MTLKEVNLAHNLSKVVFTMMKKFFLGAVIVIGALYVAYTFLSSTLRHRIDKSALLSSPQSSKSEPEYYAFGYQPRLTYSEDRSPCRHRVATKRALFGDLHIHTALSTDAFPDGTRVFPDATYRFAQGEAIAIPGRTDEVQKTLQLTRPLDFAAVTDHAGTLGEGYICRTPGAFAGYDSQACQVFRAGGEKGVRIFMTQNAKLSPKRNEGVCGENLQDCARADKIVWQDIIQSAEDAYDRSAGCGFTSFVGYEYTRSPNGQHLHRNTIFKNAQVPDRPASFTTHPTTYGLLEALETECRVGLDFCDVISIPHNSNISGGNAFNPKALDGFSMASQQAYRAYHNAYDRLMEITQHKGSSECLNEVTDILGDVDELCDVEAIRQFGQPERAIEINTYIPSLTDSDSPECTDVLFNDKDNLYKGFCLSSRDYARGALLEGFVQENKHGINPYEFGFIGSSDTHIGTAGQTEERAWGGHIAYETDLAGRLGQPALGRFNRLVSNPGGLAGVYAVENSRDAIFQSMKRREAFATSGPRIEPRFFAGHYAADICSQEDWLEKAYETGTPMGSKLSVQPAGFTLLAQAKGDALSFPLEKLQLVKGWLDRQGIKHNKVIDLATNPDGAQQFCAIYTDPDYDPALPTYYYVRAVEIGSTRWSHLQCQELAESERPESCDNDQPDMIYEIAWTSPIWFTPDYVAPLPVDPNSDAEEGQTHLHD